LKFHPSNNTDTCEPICGVRYYPDDVLKVCKECDFRCLTCTGPTYEECTSCNPLKQGVVQIDSNTCQCGSGYAINETAKQCDPCDDPMCVRCDSYDSSICYECTNAKIGVIWDPPKFGCTCVSGMYKNDDRCEYCNSLCSECTGPASTQCKPKMCSQKAYPLASKNTTCLYMCATPADNLYLDSATKTCKPCKSPCRSCYENPTTCTTCITSYVLFNSKCLKSCPSKYYADSGVCLPCSSRCIECEKKTNYCIKGCVNPYIFKDHACVDKCGEGFAPLNYTCYPCDQECAECYFDNPLGNLTTSAKICTKCKWPNYFLNGKCVTSCPSDMFPNDDYICDSCHEACVGCIGKTNKDCAKCNTALGYMKIGQELCDFPTCTQGSFYNKTLLTCVPCPDKCTECESLAVCKSCVKGWTLDTTKFKCFDPCSKLGFTHTLDFTGCTGILY